jgi:hypothetical protein
MCPRRRCAPSDRAATATGLGKVREELARRDHQVTLALLWQEQEGLRPGSVRPHLE